MLPRTAGPQEQSPRSDTALRSRCQTPESGLAAYNGAKLGFSGLTPSRLEEALGQGNPGHPVPRLFKKSPLVELRGRQMLATQRQHAGERGVRLVCGWAPSTSENTRRAAGQAVQKLEAFSYIS